MTMNRTYCPTKNMAKEKKHDNPNLRSTAWPGPGVFGTAACETLVGKNHMNQGEEEGAGNNQDIDCP